jgi:hypothetical protein
MYFCKNEAMPTTSSCPQRPYSDRTRVFLMAFFVRGSVKIIAGPRCKFSHSSRNSIGAMIWDLQNGGYYRIAAYSVNDPQQRQSDKRIKEVYLERLLRSRPKTLRKSN